jgi:HEAT repeat protein
MAGQKRQDSRLLAIELLAKGASHGEAARGAGVDKRTIQRWLKEPEFRDDIETFRAGMLSSSAGQLCQASNDAVQTLQKLLKDESASIKLGAARAILDSVIRIRELCVIEGRLTELESEMAIAKAQTTGRPLPRIAG